ncbi:MAG: hypothetical protein PHU12_04165 [Candidatus Aenigmarchaeota archaeon]|nr:hypothetical protein [Candidatus Aenigmarchaeota archaeon]
MIRPELYIEFNDKCYCSESKEPHKPHSLTWPQLLKHYRALHGGFIPWSVSDYETERLHGDMLRSIPD